MASTSSKSIMFLPPEVISIILEKKLHYRDVVNFQSTCKTFHQMEHTEKVWKKIYYNSFADKKKYYAEKRKKIPDLNFKKLIETSIKCMKDLHYYGFLMSNNNLLPTNKKKLDSLLSSIAENSGIYYLVLSEIFRSINKARLPWFRYFNLTRMYNYDTFSQQLRQYRFMFKLEKFVEMPQEKQVFERLVIILVQYFRPYVAYSIVNKWLDDIAQEVLSRIKEKYPAHSIISTSLENFSFWRNNNIVYNYWNHTETMQIFDILEKYIYSKSTHDKLHQLCRALNLLPMHANYIASYRIVKTCVQGILFNSIARRLGLYCILGISYIPENVVTILWMPKYELQNLDDAVCFCLQDRYFDSPYPQIVKTIKNGHFFEKMKTIYSGKYYLTEAMKCIYKGSIHCGFNNIWIFKILIDIIMNNYSPTKGIRVNSDITSINKLQFTKKRSHEIKFTIGMIIKHSFKTKENIYIDHIGVIIGWHYSCKCLNTESFREARQIFPHLIDCVSHQHFCYCGNRCPHYRILTNNNIICSVPQDEIRSSLPMWINNDEIGLYFSTFKETYYEPNEVLKKEYPDDMAALRKYYQQ